MAIILIAIVLLPNAARAATFVLTVVVTPNSSGTVTSADGMVNCSSVCSYSYPGGTQVTLTASWGQAYFGGSWSGGGCDPYILTPCVVTMSQPQSITATFYPAPATLQVYNSGGGTVTSDDGYINCGPTCFHLYPALGGQVTLTATPAQGYYFTGWIGSGCSGAGSCVVTLTQATVVSANFVPLSTQYPLTVSKNGQGTIGSSDGLINCGNTCSYAYPIGSQVTLTATAAPGYRLTSWIGCTSTSGSVCQVTMSMSQGVTAVFAEAAQDFNGDLMSDILWRNQKTGNVDMWFMNGPAIASAQWVWNVADPNWQIVGKGDFDGDGKADILWRNQVTGDVVIWLMNGASLAGTGWVWTVSDPNWQIAGVGDFDGDGKADILWRHQPDNALIIWLMNGTTIAGTPGLLSLGAGLQLIGIADFNGDGVADTLWRDPSTGDVVITSTNSANRFSYSVPDLNWQVVGTGDFDGDGTADILWYNKANGAAVIWFMNGLSIASSQWVYSNADKNWQVAAVGDFDGDGKADILWRNISSGAVVLWTMDGATISNSQWVYTVSDPNWQMN
ncbi:MAG TPA: FG-GAP-like repeat-containing protein [Candidatus Angelobacter sp.]|nr:FG-GAP-like repeat-containing protein [Candidatus Angelobacter sp.]